MTSFLEDQDPESRLEVGADMRKVHHCFHHLKVNFNVSPIEAIFSHVQAAQKLF